MTSTYIERPVIRHSSNMGSVVTFTDTKLRQVLVLDSAYRDLCQWGTYGNSTTELKYYNTTNIKGHWHLNSPGSVPDALGGYVCPLSTSDTELNMIWVDSVDMNTAKQNCDVWMRRCETMDTCGTVGVPAVEHARSILVNGVGCDIPNFQILMRVYLEADRIDLLDPTASDNITKTLGCMNPYGYWSCMRSMCAWSSTSASDGFVRAIYADGFCSDASMYTEHFVIPVQEL